MKKSIGAKTFLYPMPVFIVGTYDDQKRPNICAVAWGGICCSKPPSVSICLRPATYTYGNLMARKAFTISLPSEQYVKEADFAGIASGRDLDKFAAAGLTPVASDLVDAPYVKEFPMILECKVTHTLEIGLHTLFVGEILDIKVDDNCLTDKGLPDVSKIKPLSFAMDAMAYYTHGPYLAPAFSIGKELKK